MKTNKSKQISLINDFKSKVSIKNMLFIAALMFFVTGIIIFTLTKIIPAQARAGIHVY